MISNPDFKSKPLLDVAYLRKIHGRYN